MALRYAQFSADNKKNKIPAKKKIFNEKMLFENSDCVAALAFVTEP
jgi:hypothetical protein